MGKKHNDSHCVNCIVLQTVYWHRTTGLYIHTLYSNITSGLLNGLVSSTKNYHSITHPHVVPNP